MEIKKSLFSELDSLTATMIIILGLLLGSMLLTAAVQKVNRFCRELRYINMEIDRSIGEERAYWQREKRQLWRSLLTFRRR